jgi:hypothetical protein
MGNCLRLGLVVLVSAWAMGCDKSDAPASMDASGVPEGAAAPAGAVSADAPVAAPSPKVKAGAEDSPAAAPSDPDPSGRRRSQRNRQAGESRAESAPTSQPASEEASLDPAAEAEVLGFIKTNFPEEIEPLRQLKAENAGAYDESLRSKQRLMRQVAHMEPALKAAHIRRYRADRERWRILSELRRVDKDDKAVRPQLVAQLREALAQQLDGEIVITTDRLNRLENRLKQLRADLAERDANRLQVIQERLARELDQLDNRRERRHDAATQPGQAK